MYRIYSKTPDSFQGEFEFLLKKWYILEEFLPIIQFISWSLPDDEGGITCMQAVSEENRFKYYNNIHVCCPWRPFLQNY